LHLSKLRELIQEVISEAVQVSENLK
jgi:hypothetical protein